MCFEVSQFYVFGYFMHFSFSSDWINRILDSSIPFVYFRNLQHTKICGDKIIAKISMSIKLNPNLSKLINLLLLQEPNGVVAMYVSWQQAYMQRSKCNVEDEAIVAISRNCGWNFCTSFDVMK